MEPQLSAQHVGSVDEPTRPDGQQHEVEHFAWRSLAPPRSRFVVVSDEGVEEAHDGRGLTVERLAEWVARCDLAQKDQIEDGPRDLVIFDDSSRARAIITRTPSGPDLIRWLDR